MLQRPGVKMILDYRDDPLIAYAVGLADYRHALNLILPASSIEKRSHSVC